VGSGGIQSIADEEHRVVGICFEWTYVQYIVSSRAYLWETVYRLTSKSQLPLDGPTCTIKWHH
jgi:hypothetical protein